MALKMAYMSQAKENLAIYGIPKVKDLSDFCTSQKDVARGISRIPLVLARIYEEDIKFEQNKAGFGASSKYRISPSSTVKQEMSDSERLIENLNATFEHRNKAQRNSYREQQVSCDRFAAQEAGDRRGSRTLDSDFNFDDLQAEHQDTSSLLYRRDTLVNATFEDFELISIVGRGTFGKVYLVKKTLDRKLFAMKVIRKDIVIEHESIESLMLEKMILTQVNHPFIIGLNYVFQKAYRIYFIMDFVQGGELFKHLTDAKRFAEDKTKFYAAQIALALGYLHDSQIIYRDLKPENILIGKDGYIMLADFGLAKMIGPSGEDPNSFCGTPEYLSPEMIVGSGHDHTLDWWALGILIYEMIIGIPPFYNQNKHQMYNLIQHAPIRWPQKDKHGIEVSRDARDLISKMLNKNRRERLGQNKDVEEILSHPWFADLNIEDLKHKRLPAPFVPQVASQRDLQNFDADVVGQGLTESILPDEAKAAIQKQKDAFKDFGPMKRTDSEASSGNILSQSSSGLKSDEAV